MGLDTSHNAWHGSYSTFNSWRTKIAHLAGFPPLELMEGFYPYNNPFTLLEHKYSKGHELEMTAVRHLQQTLPIKWTLFEDHPLTTLLRHSDCDGHISYQKCRKIADELEKLVPLFEGFPDEYFKNKTLTFIEGLNLAYTRKEKLKFS